MLALRPLLRTFLQRPAADRVRLVRTAIRTLFASTPSEALDLLRRSGDTALTRDDDVARYVAWCARHTPDAAELRAMAARVPALAYQPRISILTPVYNTDPAWLDACAASVRAQVYPQWEWHVCDDGSTRPETIDTLARVAGTDGRIHVHRLDCNQGISAASNVALESCTGEYVGLLDHDDMLLPHAALRMVEHLNRPGPTPDVVYSDEDKLEPDGSRSDPYFKPDFSPDLLISNMYACHWLVVRASLLREIGGFRSAFDFSQDHDVMLRLMDRANRVDHLADVLYHWRKVPASGASSGTAKPLAHVAGARAVQDHLDRTGQRGCVADIGIPGFHRPVFTVSPPPAVSIVGQIASQEVPGLRRHTEYRDVEFVRDAASARGPLVLFLDCGLAPTDPSWLDALVQVITRPGVGAAGGKILGATGALEHIGLVLGLAGVAGRPFEGAPGTHAGYFGSAIVMRTVSAVTGSCLITTKALVNEVGIGAFDSVDAMAVDYCLRLKDAGLRTVFTPFARLQRISGRAPIMTSADARALRARWAGRLLEDPYYGRYLSRTETDGRIAMD
jgi:GT2 family glycosyltransferase